MSLRLASRLFSLVLAAPLCLAAQEQNPASAAAPPPAATANTEPLRKSLAALRALNSSIATQKKQIAELRTAAGQAPAAAEKDQLLTEIQTLTDNLENLTLDFEAVATGIDLESYRQQPADDVTLSQELDEFLRPILSELKDATARPREIDQLRKEVAYHTERIAKTEKAVQHLELLLGAARDPEVESQLESLIQSWRERREQAGNNLEVARFQLEERLDEKGALFNSLRDATANFFRSRGRNLAVAFLASLGVFFLLRFIHRFLHRLSPFRKRGRRSLLVRSVDVAYYAFTLIAAAAAALLVLYAASDWVLLGLAFLLLFGAAWGAKHTLPLFYEQAKLMLNLGSVREGERVFHSGLPWRVEAINIFTDLVNPALQGGRLRLPLRDLVPLVSRPFEPKEPWFPCNEHDWILLGDETFGKVVAQTPEWVQLVKLGGSRKSYTIPDFLALTPENLSTNFRLAVTFGIDYQHQQLSTVAIPATLCNRLEKNLAELVEPGDLLNLRVEFQQAGASSLDYAVLADFAGSAAPKYKTLGRAISRICVDACNDHHWVIPFTQVTLHQAAAPPPPDN